MVGVVSVVGEVTCSVVSVVDVVTCSVVGVVDVVTVVDVVSWCSWYS